jgi:hypothetical protein
MQSPKRAEIGGRALALGARMLGLVAVASLAAGCEVNNPTYYPSTGPVRLEVGTDDGSGMTKTVDLTTIEPSWRAPNAAEQTSLMNDSQRLGFAVPWLRQSETAIELTFTLKNLDDKAAVAQLAVDGANEITSYDTAAIQAALDAAAAAAGVKNEQVVLPLYQAVPITLMPQQSYQGVVREDDFHEMAIDLDAMGRWMAPPAAVLINRSEVNPIGLDMVPKNVVTPSLFRVGIAFSADAHVTCDLVLRVRDQADRLDSGDAPPFAPTPTDFVPPSD